LLHGLPNLFASVSIETLVGGGSWFTQSVRKAPFSPLAYGQVEFSQQRAKINWLLHCKKGDDSALLNLVENLSFEAGLRGSKYLLSSALLDSEEFILLRRQGFCIYGWEQYWQVNSAALAVLPENGTHWRRATSIDQHDILRFQRNHLTPTQRAVVPLADEVLPDFILIENGSIQGTANVSFTSRCGVIRFLLDTRIVNPQECMRELTAIQPSSHNNWYIQQQAGQEWLEEHLRGLAQLALPRRELLVKYFVIREKVPLSILNHATENGHPDPVAPYIHSSKS
jgi:hypothetical protein